MFVVLVYSYTMFDELVRLPDEVRKKKIDRDRETPSGAR